jgi:transcriptional regulator with XRE-family HTH domain
MEPIIDLDKILSKGKFDNELDFERAVIVNRKLRVLAKEYPELAEKRGKLRDLLIAYENRVWVESEITDDKVEESDLAEAIAEQEQLFFYHRKELIRKRLKSLSLSQKDLGKILGHNSASYMSELINGIYPFTTHDLIIIRLLLKIDFNDLIPTVLNPDEKGKLVNVVHDLKNPKLSINEQSLELVAC